LPESDLALRARVHSSLAKAYRTEGEPALAAQAYDRGISLARKSGDKSALLECMRKGNWTVGRRPDMIRSGLEICREAHQLAADLGKPQYQLDTRVDTIFQLCDLGEIDEVTHHISVLAREVSLHRQSHFFNVLVGFQASLAILQGRWRDAMEYAHTGVIQVPHQGVRGLEGRFGFQIFAINKMQGKLGEFAEIAASIIASTPEHQLWLPGEILLYCELEQHDEARRALDRLGDVYRMPDDDLRPIALVYLAEACTRLQDHARCEQLHRLLIPYRHLNATIPGTLMLGAMSGYLAKLCMQLNRHLEAGDFLDHAIELNSRMKAYPALAQNLVDYSELLLRQGIEDVSDRIGKMLSTARDHAERLELRPLLDQIATLETRDPSASLTPRECDILRLVAAGTSNKRIAGELHISYSTVATHLRNILRKAGATNRTEAVNWARKSHILD
jgi:DNA-binding CsgD family transcriptional regulator